MSENLPPVWKRNRLAEVLDDIVGGGTPSKGVPEYFRGSIPLMTVKDMKVTRPTDTGFKITEEALAASSAKIVPADTVIIATRMGLGKVVRPKMATAINQDLKALFPKDELDKSFLEHWLISIASKIEAMGTGTTVKGVRLNQIRELEIPLPPLNEQRRIVEKIETLFARLDKGEESLRAVQKLLARYRQSVLKAAVTGELTADWRAENAHRLEHGLDLLTRILKTRRENWPGRGRYKEPFAPDTADLTELPAGWVWASVEQLLRGDLLNGRSVPDAEDGFPVLRLTALKEGQIDIRERKIGQWTKESAAPFLIRRGDILVSRGNGSKKLVGKGGLVVNEPDPVAYPDTMIRIPILLDFLSPEWFLQLWNSSFMRSQIEGAARTTAGIYKINQTDIRGFRVPLPPVDEQLEIAAKVSEALARIDAVELWCNTELARSGSLRQSVLKDAFAGRLADQDPNDEPAGDLLARTKRLQPLNKKTKSSKREIKI